LSAQERLDRACQRFEQAWQAGSRPRAEDCWGGATGAEGRALLRELLALELKYRRRQGEFPTAEEIHRRFPGHEALIATLFSPEPSPAAPAPGLQESTTNLTLPTPVPKDAASLEETQPDGLPAKVGRYRIEEKLGQGGMGVVWRARDLDLKRSLAVKVLRHDQSGQAELARRFLEEAQITGQLQHPGVAPVHEVGTLEDGRPFFAMKLVKGCTLADLLKDRQETTADRTHFLTIFEQVCQTLAYAHSKGVIHRDLKPSNIMVGAFAEVQVMDWGLAKVLGRDTPECTAAENPAEGPSAVATVRTESPGLSSQAGSVLGTPAYMAPEQARGEVDGLDRRCDVFGLGAILCAILTGRPPYPGPTREAVYRQAARGDLAEAFARLDGCGAEAELVRLAKACLCPEREGRPRDAGEVAGAVAAYRAGVQERLHQSEREQAAAQVREEEQRKRRRLRLVLAAALLLVVGLAGDGVWWLLEQQAQNREDVETSLEQAEVRLRQSRWDEAETALKQAVRQLGKTGPEDLQRRLEQVQRNLDLARRLENIRLQRMTLVDGKLNPTLAPPAYARAFQEYNLFPGTDDVESLGRRIAASGIKRQLVTALDNWAGWERNPGMRRRLLALTQAVDPQPWRARFSPLAMRGDRKALQRLADEAEVERLSPALVVTLANFLNEAKGDATELLQRALQEHTADFWLNFMLAAILHEKHKGEAIGYYRAALAVRPRSTVVRLNLGFALQDQGRVDEAIACFHKAIHLDPKYALAHMALGMALALEGRVDESMACFQKALQLDPKDAKAHTNLGVALHVKGRRAEAIACFEKAIQLDPESFHANYALGKALLGQGRLTEARDTMRRWRQRLPKHDRLRSFASQQLRQCERLLVLDARLPALLQGHQQPASVAEHLEYAQLCRYKKLHAAATRLFAEAFAADAKQADDLKAGHRYNAACAAALAASGKGGGAGKLDGKERARLRQYALDWLRADLAAWARMLEKGSPQERVLVRPMLLAWEKNTALASLRDPQALANLPAAERQAWQKLWAYVKAVLRPPKYGTAL
jgi:serine/threonine-protein kinase